MSVIPILITAIVSSLAQLMKDPNARKYIARILLVFVAVLAFTAIFGTATGVFAKPGENLGERTSYNFV